MFILFLAIPSPFTLSLCSKGDSNSLLEVKNEFNLIPENSQKVAVYFRNGWQFSPGMVATYSRNGWQVCTGFCSVIEATVFSPEYAFTLHKNMP
jgi:hypothetical protein